MPWPWVRRADYEAACREIRGLEARVVEWRTAAQAADARFQDYVERHLAFYSRSVAQYDALLEKYHALKVKGAAPETAIPVLETKAYDPIADAITRKAGANLQLRGLMGRRATREQAAGVPVMTIVEHIESGQTDDEGPAY